MKRRGLSDPNALGRHSPGQEAPECRRLRASCPGFLSCLLPAQHERERGVPCAVCGTLSATRSARIPTKEAGGAAGPAAAEQDGWKPAAWCGQGADCNGLG